MKNIFLLPTDKPTGIFETQLNGLQYSIMNKVRTAPLIGYHIFITTDNKFVKDEWLTDGIEVIQASPKLVNAQGLVNRREWKKIILTTDPDLIKDGVQPIDDEFLEWFIKNPSCEFVEVETINNKWHNEDGSVLSVNVYGIIIPKEEPQTGSMSECIKGIIDNQLIKIDNLKKEILPEEIWNDEKKQRLKEFIDNHKQETLKIEKLAMDKLRDKWAHLYTFGYPQRPYPTNYENDLNCVKLGIYEGQRLQAEELFKDEAILTLETALAYLLKKQEKMYTTEEVIDLIQFLSMNEEFNGYGSVSKETAKHFLEDFKKQ
jgi:hypothetical protein